MTQLDTTSLNSVLFSFRAMNVLANIIKMTQLEMYTISPQIQNILQRDRDDLEFSNLKRKIQENENEENIYVELMKTVLFFEESLSSNSFDMNNIKIKINSNQMSITPVSLPNLNFQYLKNNSIS